MVNILTGPVTKAAYELVRAIDGLPASEQATALVIQAGALMEQVEKLEIEANKFVGGFNEYQQRARMTAIYPSIGSNLGYPTLGLCGETGEVAEKVKKLLRDKGGVPTVLDIDALVKELGDVLWYIAAVASELKVDLSVVADQNLAKLASRKERDALKGSGDNR